MGEYIRRLVSGKKARHKDPDLDLELDLAYITDNVIVMGYPASGIEGLYRNRKEDAKKFLEHRHGKNFWVFNFCPVKENSYPSSVFDGRVSRYPFPDHHAPPLAVLPLVAREINLWLDGSPERVVVLHCKAGKGRSGTMACAYLLTLNVAPGPPVLDRGASVQERAKLAAEQVMNAMPVDESAAELISATTQPEEDLVKLELADGGSGNGSRNDAAPHVATPPETDSPDASDSSGQQPPTSASASSSTGPTHKDTTNSLSHVLELHTARRMQSPSSPNSKLKQGVSIPSQRRWLYYWSLALAHEAPPGFWTRDPGVRPAPKVRMTEIRLRMRELGGLKGGLVRAANALLEGASKGRVVDVKSASRVWASLARYDDELVTTLERWERHTRDDSPGENMGVRRKGSDEMSGVSIGELFADGKWDSKKMVRSFARMGPVRDEDIKKETSDDYGKVETYSLCPLSGDKWQLIRDHIASDKPKSETQGLSADAVREAEDPSMYDVTQSLEGDGGVVLDAHREVRVKLYIGQVFMGWFWFIPTFHMPHPRGTAEGARSTTLVLKRKELDFPVGIGANIIDVAVTMEWCPEAADVIDPPERATSRDIAEGREEPAGVAVSLPAVVASEGRDVVEAQQAAEE